MLEQTIRAVVEELGFEFVSLERGGSSRRPFLRVRIDTRESEPGHSGVGVEDCTRVSRAVQQMLEVRDGLRSDYVLEVSSPGVERPLVRPEDYDRFAGRAVQLRGYEPLVGKDRVVVGTLVGRVGEGHEKVAVELAGERVEIPLASVARARLVYDGTA
ncbi:MAG: ribosome maturation factor RimP [Gemmatimonadota bacterium]